MRSSQSADRQAGVSAPCCTSTPNCKVASASKAPCPMHLKSLTPRRAPHRDALTTLTTTCACTKPARVSGANLESRDACLDRVDVHSLGVEVRILDVRLSYTDVSLAREATVWEARWRASHLPRIHHGRAEGRLHCKDEGGA